MRQRPNGRNYRLVDYGPMLLGLLEDSSDEDDHALGTTIIWRGGGSQLIGLRFYRMAFRIHRDVSDQHRSVWMEFAPRRD